MTYGLAAYLRDLEEADRYVDWAEAEGLDPADPSTEALWEWVLDDIATAYAEAAAEARAERYAEDWYEDR